MIAMIDNYDSFTFNLVQYLAEMGEKLVVFRNDEISVADLIGMNPERIVISPGPGRPADAGISIELIKAASEQPKPIPVLGVCLGHQAIGEAFGGNVIHAGVLVHGKASLIKHDNKTIFAGLPNPFMATRYHSLIVERSSLPACLEVSAETEDGLIMALRHKELPVEGVQFHPESILTNEGKALLKNFLRGTRIPEAEAV
ncbi:MAG: aminodeoxychorismate/anthranilate synthase component II [Rubrobacteridae bacterium]|nr:aminodeoxychorismate/anthranilate synthase component II [Rubrobacteridae bacterium]